MEIKGCVYTSLRRRLFHVETLSTIGGLNTLVGSRNQAAVCLRFRGELLMKLASEAINLFIPTNTLVVAYLSQNVEEAATSVTLH